MPALTLVMEWQVGLWIDAMAAVGMALLLERWRPAWDADRRPATPLAASPFRAVGIVWRQPSLRMMAFAGAGIVAAQICMQSYTVPMFYEQFALTLVEAGWILTVSQLGGTFGRPFWGWLADRRRDCLTVLALLACTLALATLCVGTLPWGWPRPLVYVLFFVFGATASGWNGAFLGEVARAAPPGLVSTATGGSLFFVNVASITAPIVFANIYAATTNYSLTFALLTATSAASIGCLLRARQYQRLSASTQNAGRSN